MKILIVAYLVTLLSCGAASKKQTESPQTINIQSQPKKQKANISLEYDFESPSQTFVLNYKLREISSLAYDDTNHTFLTNDDESGRFFILKAEDFSILREIKFSKRGDYESIEKIGDDIFVCKNNGTLYSYNLTTNKSTTYKNKLKTYNDVEGLCYHKSENVLLLACKGQAINEKRGAKNKKCIYAYELEKSQLNPQAFITITDDSLMTFVENNFENESKSQLKKLKNKAKDFSPSGIAIHPKSGDFYIISAKGSSLVIIDKNKNLKQVVFLNNKTNPQPEGITFDADLNLYISTEGQGYSGKIFKYKYNGKYQK